MLVCPGLMALIWFLAGGTLSLSGMATWLVIFYLLSLTLEVIWIVRALRAVANIPKEKSTPSQDSTPREET